MTDKNGFDVQTTSLGGDLSESTSMQPGGRPKYDVRVIRAVDTVADGWALAPVIAQTITALRLTDEWGADVRKVPGHRGWQVCIVRQMTTPEGPDQ